MDINRFTEKSREALTTAQGLAALQSADLIIGAKRLLEHLPTGCTENRKALYKPENILSCLSEFPAANAALLYSGDTGFYSGASKLLPMLRASAFRRGCCPVFPACSFSLLPLAVRGRIGSSSRPTAVPVTRQPSA